MKWLFLLGLLMIGFRTLSFSQEGEIVPGLNLRLNEPIPTQPLSTVSCVDLFSLKQNWGSRDPGQLYVLESAPVVSFVYPREGGLEVFVQDGSAAIPLFCGLEAPVDPFIRKGDQLDGLMGYMTLIEGSLVFIPVLPPEITAHDQPLFPYQLNLTDLMLNPWVYDAALVHLQDITCNGEGTKFVLGDYYVIYQQQATSALYACFANVDYLGTPVPSAKFDLTGLIIFDRLKGTVTITPRSLSDFTFSYGNDALGSWSTDELYASDGFLQIWTKLPQQVQVFSPLGNLLIQEWVSAGHTQLEIGGKGVYIVRMGQLVKKIMVP